MVLLAGASAGIAAAGSGSAVILWRVAQGLGTSMLVATALPILVAVVPRDERGAAIGINVAAVYLGLSTGPYLGGLLTGLWSWRAVFVMYLPDATSTVRSIVLRLLVLGFGFGLFSSPNTNAIMGAVEPSRYGLAGAMAGTMRQLGMVLSMAVVMLLLSRHLGNEEIVSGNAAELLYATRISLVVFSLLCFGGIFASLARGPSRS